MNEDVVNVTCPRCGTKGKKIKAITFESQVTESRKAELESIECFRFCPAGDCSAAYYRSEDRIVVDKTETRFPIFQKEKSAERLVCYCFKHSVQEILDEVSATGDTKVIQEIKSSCKQGMDDCARNNPQGSCCLGNVSKVVKEAKGLANEGGEKESDACSCSPSDEEPDVEASMPESCCSDEQCIP